MPSYSDTYARRSEPNAWMWYSVYTPGAYLEFKLPADDHLMTKTHKRQYRELKELAETHGTAIHASPYRRG